MSTTQKVYIQYCRYYDGNDEKEHDSNFGFYEKHWVEEHKTGKGLFNLKSLIAEYKDSGLGSFMADDGTPISLKALLYNRFKHWSCYSTTNDFKRFYMQEYLGMRMRNWDKR